MLRQVYTLLFLLVLLSCKQDSMEQPMLTDTASMAGTWRLIETEKGGYGQKFWEATAAKPSDTRIIRQDGVILDSDSLQVCCSPNSLLINGHFFKLPADSTIQKNPVCAVTPCLVCDTWEIERRKKDQIIITYCDGVRMKYVR
jgi:hypothetical protein